MKENNFIPKYKLIKKYPGMDKPIGTVFGVVSGWSTLQTKDGHGCTSWEEEYFKPWIDIFFEKLN